MSSAILVQGLAYGDEGKGATVDFLCRHLPVSLVVRFNGGSQAAHNVVTPHGVHHTFSQFGSGMLASGAVRTHLSRFMLVDPLSMMNEGDALAAKAVAPWERLSVDPNCVVVTPFHKLLNRWRETRRGEARHGSCGMGVGVAREWSLRYPGHVILRVGDLTDFNATKMKLRFQEDWLYQELGGAEFYKQPSIDKLDLTVDYYNWVRGIRLQEELPKADLTVFEGAQGVLLDETHGEAPHNTWTDCTFANADTLCAEAGISERFRIGCLRTYLTRHGAGQLKEFEGGQIPEDHNATNDWQGPFRSGPMYFPLIRKAISHIGRLDCIALSHLDCAESSTTGVSVQKGFERGLGVRIGITAKGPTAAHREFTPQWSDAWRRLWMEEEAQHA